ncbi:hypothetical protein [Brevibacillus laterosporus]|uniref:hypothetical protein n=1 Tax=Brevibacillus laterosporus TaxID=1465 RepID=UPI003D1CA9EC
MVDIKSKYDEFLKITSNEAVANGFISAVTNLQMLRHIALLENKLGILYPNEEESDE